MTASLSPVLAALRTIEVGYGSASLHGLVPGLLVNDVRGWTRASAVSSGAGLTDLLDTAKQRWRAQPHAAAALAWKCYTYWTALPALVGFAAARRVPLPRVADTLLRYSEHQPFLTVGLHRPSIAVLATDPLAASRDPRVIVCADDDALLAELRRTLVDEHLEPLLAGIRSRVHLGRRTLMGSLASGAAHGLARAADSIPGSIVAAIETALRGLDVADLVDIGVEPGTGVLSIQRRTCCLAVTLPEPRICSGCCIR